MGRTEAHVIGSYRTLQIAELPARDTPFPGLAIRETKLRERTGLSVVGTSGTSRRSIAPGPISC